jgi:prepilin-type N-terminal cleavage/methylation domain-containing protein
MNTKNNNKGITLLELLIATVIIGIVATLAIPRFGQVMEKLKLKTAGRDIVSSLRLARSNAVSQRDQFGVYFDLYSRQYVLFKDLANPGSFTYDVGADSDMVTNTLPGSVNFGYSSFSNSVVIFKPDGSASSSGAVDLYSYEEGYYGSFTVDVLSSTGRVKLLAGSYTSL